MTRAPLPRAANRTGPRFTTPGSAPLTPNTPETPQHGTPKFRGWLASGANQATGGPAGTGERSLLVGPNSLGGTATSQTMRSGARCTASARQTTRAASHGGLPTNPPKRRSTPGRTLASLSNPLADAQSPPHVGHQAIPDLEEFDWKAGQRSIAVTNGSVNLAADLGTRGIGNLNHDITVHSAGVLATCALAASSAISPTSCPARSRNWKTNPSTSRMAV